MWYECVLNGTSWSRRARGSRTNQALRVQIGAGGPLRRPGGFKFVRRQVWNTRCSQGDRLRKETGSLPTRMNFTCAEGILIWMGKPPPCPSGPRTIANLECGPRRPLSKCRSGAEPAGPKVAAGAKNSRRRRRDGPAGRDVGRAASREGLPCTHCASLSRAEKVRWMWLSSALKGMDLRKEVGFVPGRQLGTYVSINGSSALSCRSVRVEPRRMRLSTRFMLCAGVRQRAECHRSAKGREDFGTHAGGQPRELWVPRTCVTTGPSRPCLPCWRLSSWGCARQWRNWKSGSRQGGEIQDRSCLPRAFGESEKKR